MSDDPSSWMAEPREAPQPVRIGFSWGELRMGVHVGVWRRIIGIRQRKTPKDAAKGLWDDDINGALAELAGCKYTGTYWAAALEPGAIDIAPNIQARSKTLWTHRLVVKTDNNPSHKFIDVLIDVTEPAAYLCGWLFGHEAQQPQWLEHHPPKPPMFFVPDTFLHPMDTL